MQTRKLIWAMFFASVLLFSCEKEKVEVTKSTQQKDNIAANRVSPDGEIEKRIRTFEANLQKPSNINYTLKDAVWDIEANFNAYYCIPAQGKSDVQKSTRIQVSTVKDEISMREIVTAHTKMKEFFVGEYNKIDEKLKWMNTVDIDYIVEDGTTYFDVKATYQTLNGLDQTGDWKWSFEHGDCSGNNAPNDAGKIIASKLRQDYVTYISNWLAHRYYYTDIAYKSFNGNDDPDPTIPRPESLDGGVSGHPYANGLNNPLDNVATFQHTVSTSNNLQNTNPNIPNLPYWPIYEPFNHGSTNQQYQYLKNHGYFHTCLTQEEIEYYYLQGKYLIGNLHYPGFTTMDIYIWSDFRRFYGSFWPLPSGGTPNGYDVYYQIRHHLVVKRGIKHDVFLEIEEMHQLCFPREVFFIEN